MIYENENATLLSQESVLVSEELITRPVVPEMETPANDTSTPDSDSDDDLTRPAIISQLTCCTTLHPL